MDALSDVLKSVHLDGAVFLDAEFAAPWCVRARFGLSRARAGLPGDRHVALFHWLTEGTCKVRLADGADTLDLAAGDLILFAHDDQHLLGSDLQRLPVESASLFDGDAAAPCSVLRAGGEGDVTRFVCGYVACDRALLRPLLGALPRMLRIAVGDGPTAPLLRELLRAGVHESALARPGGASTLAKLAELLFVEALRCHAASLPPDGRGWLAGLRDAHVGRALALLHGTPARAWSVDELAREVALSRSALAERFTTLVGESPIQYLLRWRLALAAQELRAEGAPITRIAERAGYESEAAFSRAFKRQYGLPPSAWRRHADA
ncbi:MAG: AraC family transcriptional regulator [Rhodanobacteraceae bacterium]|jgi:AraC-like DNA-binding protein|nr:AraC family transcriptional regulator [Rhodanobacteraceae bacterium]